MCKQPTLPFSLLKSHAFFFFIWPLYCFLHILPDDLVFHLCVLSSNVVWVLPLFSKKAKLRKKHALEIHVSHCHFIAFLPWVTKFIEHSVVTLVCNYHFQLWPGSLPSCSLFFNSLHKPHGVSSLALAIFQGLSSLLIFLLLLHSHAWLLHSVLPARSRPPAAHRFMALSVSYCSPPSSHWLQWWYWPIFLVSSFPLQLSGWSKPQMGLSRACPGHCTSIWAPSLRSAISDCL